VTAQPGSGSVSAASQWRRTGASPSLVISALAERTSWSVIRQQDTRFSFATGSAKSRRRLRSCFPAREAELRRRYAGTSTEIAGSPWKPLPAEEEG
jgi:hypothetical protein